MRRANRLATFTRRNERTQGVTLSVEEIMPHHNRNRTTFLALVIEALGAPPAHVIVLESIFQAGVGQALVVNAAEVQADDRAQIGNQVDHFWTVVHAVGLTPMQVTSQAFGYAERCGYAVAWYELTAAVSLKP